MFSHYCILSGHLNARSEVYSFGVVLLEILTGKEALDYNRPAEEEDLVEWARPYLTSKRKVLRIVDPRLDTQYLPEEAVRMASIADWRCSVSRSNQSHVRPWTKWSVPCNIFRTTWEYRLRPIRLGMARNMVFKNVFECKYSRFLGE